MADGTPFHLAEHLSLLAKHGKGLALGFHNLHRMLSLCDSQQKPSPGSSAEYNVTKDAVGSEPSYRLFTDSSLSSVVKLLVKRFPDPTDASKATGFETFSRFQREISNELQSPYQLMVDFYEFHEVCLAVFQQIEKTEGITLATTPDIFLDYLRVTSTFIACHVLFGLVGTERKSIAAAFSKAYTLVNGIPEPNFKRLSTFLSNFDRPFHVVQEELHLIPPGKLSTALASLRTEFEVGPLTPAETLRKMSVLSLVNTTTGGVRSGETRIESTWLRSLTNMDTYLSAVVIGFMACPAELLKLANGQETLKLALGDGICTPLVRNEMLAVYAEYEAVSKINSKYKKLANIISDGTANFGHAAALHRDRREYLRHQLRQIYSLCSHNPQIMASLFTVVCTALSLAVHEVMWYFSNLERSASVAKKASGSKKDVKVLDGTITEIMWFTESIRRLAVREKDGIQTYFYQQLTLHAGSQLQPLLFSMRSAVPAISESVIQIIEGTISLINEGPPSGSTEQLKTKLPSLEGIRVNWARIQVCLTMPQTVIHPEKVDIISTTMSEMSLMSKYIDTFDEHLDSVGSLKGLFYYRYTLLEHLNDTLENFTDQLRYVDVYLALAEEFPKNASSYWSSELEWIGQQSAMFAQEALSRISKKAADVFYDVVLTYVSYGKQFTPDYLAAVLAVKQDQKKSGTQKKSAQTQISLPPGWESHLGSGSEVVAAGLYTQKTALNNLWRAISSQDEFYVHDRILSPRDYFTDAFGDLARKWFSSNAFLDVDGHTTKEASNLLPDEVLPYRLKRPSYYLNELRSFLSAMQIADGALKIDFSGAIADLMKEQLDSTACRKLYDAQSDQVIYRPAKQKSRRSNEGLPKANATHPILLTYTTWYVDMVANKATTGGVCYSPARQALVSRSQLEFKAEEYTDICELTALCQFLGAEGIRFMNERLMKVVTVMASGIKDVIVENAEMLKVLQQHWKNSSRTEGILFKLHGIDEFVTKSTVLGVAAEFRKLLLGALEMELKAKTHLLWSTLYHLDSETQKQNPSSEELVHRSGIITPSDPAARGALLLLCNNSSADRATWAFLPYIFAAGIWYMAYSGPALYNPWLEALENNTHCIAAAFDLLTITVSNILSPGDSSLAQMMQQEFLKVASTFLLRLKATTPDKDGLPREIESLYYIVRRVGDNSTVLTRESIEYGHPYSILKLTMGENFRCRFTVNQKGKRVVNGSLLYTKSPGVDEETGY